LLFANDGDSDSVNAQGFMQKLSMMLARDSHRASMKRLQKDKLDTIQNLAPVVKQVFTKIKDQLDDRSHPLVMIISSF